MYRVGGLAKLLYDGLETVLSAAFTYVPRVRVDKVFRNTPPRLLDVSNLRSGKFRG